MTDLLTRPAARVRDGVREGVRAPRPLRYAAPAAASGAALLGLLVVAVPVLIAWTAATTAAPDAAGALGAARVTSVVWLAAHHVAVGLPEGSVSLLPLGLLVVPAWLLYAAGRWLAGVSVGESVAGGALRRAVHATGALAGSYALVTVLVAGVAGTTAARPVLWQAAVAGVVLALAAGGAGVARASGAVAAVRERIPLWLPALLRSAAGGVVAALGIGMAVTTLALAVRGPDVAALASTVDPGLVGALVLLLASAAYLPNLALWAVAFGAGPGFAVGVGTTVSLPEVRLGDLPAVPPLGALPDAGQPLAVGLPALLVPLTAGVVAGVLTAQRRAGGLPAGAGRTAALAALAGAAAGAVLGILAGLAGGSLGAERLTQVGPSGWHVAAAAALEIAGVAAATAWLLRSRSERRGA